MTETKFWGWMLKGRRLPPGAYTRIESECSPGIPDVAASISFNGDIWIELKIGGPGPYPFKGERKGLRASQIIWMTDRVAHGSRVYVMAVMRSDVAMWRMTPALIRSFNLLNRDALQRKAIYWRPKRGIKLTAADFT